MNSIPKNVETLARSIVKSWVTADKSNYTVIAPPMSIPRELFRLLADRTFLHNELDNASSRIAIAQLGEADYLSQTKFLRKLAVSWGSEKAKTCQDNDLLMLISSSLKTLRSQGQLPVILIERFHSGLQRLDESFGVDLRNLEADHRLSTVVEVPIKLDDLRDRWEDTSGGCPFLQSDWGQGYESIFLKGYSESEIKTLLREKNKDASFSTFIFRATAGLPVLVDLLVGKTGTMGLPSLQKFAEARSLEYCSQFFNWLEAETSTIYKKLLQKSLSERLPKLFNTSLANHSWAPWILDSRNDLNFLMLAWASVQKLETSNQAIFLRDLFKTIEADELDSALSSISPLANLEGQNQALWLCLEALCQFFAKANPNGDQWIDASIAVEEIKRLATEFELEPIRAVSDMLMAWRPLINLMIEFSARRSGGTQTRFEDLVCEKNSLENAKLFLQRLRLKSSRANRLVQTKKQDYHDARASILSHPESLLQVYSHVKFGIKFWKYEPLQDIKATIFLGRTFKPPVSGKRLEFTELLFLYNHQLACVTPEEGLFENDAAMGEICDLYQDRSEQSHSTTVVTANDWSRYYQTCSGLIERFWRTISEQNETLDLPDIGQCLAPLKKALADSHLG